MLGSAPPLADVIPNDEKYFRQSCSLARCQPAGLLGSLKMLSLTYHMVNAHAKQCLALEVPSCRNKMMYVPNKLLQLQCIVNVIIQVDSLRAAFVVTQR